jgi:acyl-CoA thioesterase
MAYLGAMQEHPDVDLVHALSLTREGSGFAANVTPDWAQGRAAFGGLVVGLAVRAMAHELPPTRLLRSLLVDFVSPVAPGPAQVQAHLLREGRALSHAEARVLQNGAVCAIVTGAFGAARASTLRLEAAQPAEVPPPLALRRMPYVEGVFPRFTKHFEYRWSSPNFPFTGASQAKIGGYVRHAGPADSDLAGLLCLIDAWPPALLPALRAPAPASSVTWMVDLVAPELIPATTWDVFYRYEAETLAAGDCYGSIEGRIWSPTGELIAASRQLVAEFSGG